MRDVRVSEVMKRVMFWKRMAHKMTLKDDSEVCYSNLAKFIHLRLLVVTLLTTLGALN